MLMKLGLRFLFAVNFSSSNSIRKSNVGSFYFYFLFTFSLVHTFPDLLLTFKCGDRAQVLTYASVPSVALFHPYNLIYLMEKFGGFLGSF